MKLKSLWPVRSRDLFGIFRLLREMVVKSKPMDAKPGSVDEPSLPPPRSAKEIAQTYFVDHPEEKDGVMKAYHAYHVAHFRLDGGAHNFLSSSRTCECFWCGRTRENVRWDDLPPECQKRPSDADLGIGEVLESEENKAHAIYEKAKVHVPRLVKKMGMSGETLATLHHTHGYDPETVSGVVDVPPEMMTAYNANMETERDRSRKAIVREVISCVFDESLPNA